MTNIYINPVTGTDTATGSQEQPYKTWTQVNPQLQAGVTVLAANGTYADAPKPTASGTKEQPIRIVGASNDSAIIAYRIDLPGIKHIEISNVRLHATRSAWLTMDAASEGIVLDKIRHTSEVVEGATPPFTGIYWKGKNHRWTRSSMEGWIEGDAFWLESSYTLIEDLDCAEGNACHAVFGVGGSHNVIRGSDRNKPMKITNRYDRAGGFFQKTERQMECIENLFENVHIYLCNYDGEYAIPDPYPSQKPGADNMLKFGGDGTIGRNVTIEKTARSPHKDFNYTNAMQMGNYGTSYHFRNQRWYFLRLIDNDCNAIAVTVDTTRPHDYSNVEIFNSEIRGNRAALYSSRNVPMSDLPVIHNSIIADPLSIRGVSMTLAEYQAAYPKLAYGNTDGSTEPILAPLGRVKVASNGAVVTLDDCWGIHDGKGMVGGQGKPLGDVLVIGDNPPVRVKRKISPTQVELVAPVTVKVGDPVWLDVHWLEAVTPEPEPEPTPEPIPEPEPTPEPVAGVTLSIEGEVTVTRVEEEENEE